MSAEELGKVIEEFLFWEKIYKGLCLNKKLPGDIIIPKNEVVWDLLREFEEERDYYSIMYRRKVVRKKIF